MDSDYADDLDKRRFAQAMFSQLVDVPLESKFH